HYPNKWQVVDGPGINYYSAIRKGDWKLVYSMRQQKLELYNLKEDIGEQQDKALQHPEKVKELSKLLSDQLRIWKAPMLTYKANGNRVPYPDEVKLP
ncbi:sulfatase, partial [Flavihumibacter sediminis]|nr:sulfatase [Flavihumibacter sediminis]